MGHRSSDVDEVQKISTSIFVINFPDQFYAKDVWKVCNQYGNVVDAFILNRRSKSGKRFGFVRFIKIFDVDCLVNNLCMNWVKRFKLYANIARFQRPPLKNSNTKFINKAKKKSVPGVVYKDSRVYGYSNSYAHIVKIGPQSQSVEEENKPAIVLDETCVNQQDYSTSLMGKVKEFGSLTKLKTEASKEKFKANVGIGSWFSQLEHASNLFHKDERVTWGDLLHVKDQDEGYFNSKRFCIKTNLVENIFESFKIITQGKVLWVRAKEVSGWIPDFLEDDEEEIDSDDEIRDEELHDESACMHNHATMEGESDVEEVSETIFENKQYQAHKKDDLNVRHNDIRLEDPFNIYDLLKKKQDNIIGGSSLDNMNSKIHSHGDFNEVCKNAERYGSIFNVQVADAFNSFILAAGLEVVPLGGCSFTWCHKLATKMSKLDHFLIPEVQRVVDAGMFRGISMGPSLHLSNLFYADDVVFIGHWSDSNIYIIVQVLECFYRASGLCINLNKSILMGILMANVIVDQAAAKIGCVTLEAPFSYLGSKVGSLMSRVQSWNEIVNNLVAQLSNWKMKTLSIGGILTLLKSRFDVHLSYVVVQSSH
nr:nucleotide-binding alpha-beta plait domain-containing protein [Tanacetum cinerariifolium]